MKILYLTHLDYEFKPEGTLPIGATCDVRKIDKIPYSLLFNGYLFKTYISLKGLDLDYDVIHYVTDRYNFQKATDSDLRGRHNRILGKSYCRSLIDEGKYVVFKEGVDHALDRRRGDMLQSIYTPLHENLHAKSNIVGKNDVLHEWIALGKFNEYDSVYLKKIIEVPNGLLPKIQRDADRFVELANKAGFSLRITSGFRSIEEQDELYAQGRTKPGNIVTNARGGYSTHNYGVAFDIVDRLKGYNLTQKDWALLAILWHIIGGRHTSWGGLWTSFVDKPHFENLMGYTLEDFRNGTVDYSKFD